MTLQYLKRSGLGLVAIGLGVAAFLITLTVLQQTAQAQKLAPQLRAAQRVKVQPASTQTVTTDLSITKTNDLTEVVAGMTVVYTITARNNSTGTITNALVVDYVPAQYQPQVVSVFGSNVLALKILTFTIGEPVYVSLTLGVGGVLNLVLSGTVADDASGILTNTATITAPDELTETNLANNTATDADPISATQTTPEGALLISATDGVTQVVTGQAVTYTIIVTNPTVFPLDGVRITDTLPVGFVLSRMQAYSTHSIPPEVGTAAGNSIVTATASFGPQGIISITMAGTVGLVPSALLTNTAMVAAPPGLSRVAGGIVIDVNQLADAVPPNHITYLPLILQP